MRQITRCMRGLRFDFLAALIVLSHLMAVETVRSSEPSTGTSAVGLSAKNEIFVASNGWHSAIFISRAAIPGAANPVAADFPTALFLGFGWGDAKYFPNRDPGVMNLLSAALLPTPSVLHVTGLPTHPRDAFPKDEVIGLKVSPDGFSALLRFLNAAFSRDGAERLIVYAPGLHSYSTFYRATGEFHLFNNCNSWTARGLVAAGIPIDADSILRAADLMESLRQVAK